MKNRTKIISLFLALVLVMSGFTVVSPVFAAKDKDFSEADLAAVGEETVNEDNCLEYLKGLGVDIDTLHKMLEDAIVNCKASIDVTNFKIPVENVRAIKYYIKRYLPDYYAFVLTTYLSYTYNIGSEQSTVAEYRFYYYNRTNTPEKMQQVLTDSRTARDAILDGIRGNSALTDVEKALLVHDRLAAHVYYDHDTWAKDYYADPANNDDDSYTAYGALVKGKAVCGGYALAYEYLMNLLGIRTVYVSASEMDHGWDVIFIGGKPYFVDVTWDDVDSGMHQGVKHNNFLRSAKGFTETGHTLANAETYINGIPINDTTYDNYYWQDSEAEFLLSDNNKIYYLDNAAGTLNRADKNHTVLYTIPEDKNDDPNVCRIGDALFLSYSGKIYRFNTKTEKLSTTPIASPDELNIGRLWGVTVAHTLDVCSWEWKDGKLTVSGSGDMGEYFLFDKNSVIGYYSRLQEPLSDLIGKAAIGKGVTRIGFRSFNHCHGLTDIDISDSVKDVGERAFCNCYSLKTVKLGSGVEIIGDRAFYNCRSLTNLTLPSTVKSIGAYAFYDCDSLTDFVVPDKVKSIGEWTFYSCDKLKNVKIGSGVESIGDQAFYNCDSLTEIVLPDSVKSIGDQAFYSCDNLSSAELGNSVESIGEQAFDGCFMYSIKLPDTVKSVGKEALGYRYGKKISTFIIRAHEGTAAASYASKNTFTLNNPDEFVEWKLNGTELIISGNGNMDDYDTASNNAPWGKDITKVTIRSGVKSIGAYAFYNCDNLTEIVLPDSVKSIGEQAFYSCDSLKAAEIGNSLESIGDQAFDGCFMYSLKLPDTVRSIGKNALGYRYGKKINNFIIRAHEGSVAAGYAAENGFILRSPDESIEWKLNGTELIISGNGYMDEYDTASNNAPWGKDITKVTVQKGVKGIGAYAFYNCDGLTEIVLPDSVKTIGAFAFYSCDKLGTADLGNGVETIGEQAFDGCALQSVTVPAGVKSIGTNALGYRYGRKMSAFTISSLKGNDAERYASENGFDFTALSEMPTVPTEPVTVPATDKDKDQLLGDTDGDGVVTIIDATYIQRKLANLAIPFEFRDDIADTDGDGDVSILDTTLIQRWLVNLPANDNIGKPVKS